MSDPTDIKALDEYLKGGSDVSQRYRELGRDEVPPELDRRVLAAARDAVANEGTKRSRSWLRWSTPVALAASVVLVVTVVLERGGQDRMVAIPQAAPQAEAVANAIEERKQAEEFVPQPEIVSPPQVVTPAAAPPPPPQRAKEKAEASRDKADEPQVYGFTGPSEIPAQAPEVRDEAPAQSQPQAAPSAAAPPPEPVSVSAGNSLERNTSAADSSAEIQEVVITGGVRRSAGRAGPRGTVTRALSSTHAAPVAEPGQSDPQAWLEDIRDLRRSGKTDEADREWERFRKTFPDFEVADDDVARKKP